MTLSLATTYLGLALKNPLVASASPQNGKLDVIRRLEDAGAAAIVLPSLFQEQIEAEADAHGELMDSHAYNSPEAQSYFPAAIAGPYGLGPERYLDLVRQARAAVGIPIIASLNGATKAGWFEYALLIEQAGAAALELNMYHVPTDLSESGQDVEDTQAAIVGAVCEAVQLPVSVKLTPYLSSIGHFATRLIAQGAAGLVLFNRLLPPEMDVLHLRLTDTLALSTPAELRLPLLWTAILAGRTKRASLATSSGVATADDVVKCLLAGADVAMTTSALLKGGPGEMRTLVNGLTSWLEEREFTALEQMRGVLSWQRSKDRSVYTRANYLRILDRYSEKL
jgi:dihydroorotate dehydrogenase (fumarate)